MHEVISDTSPLQYLHQTDCLSLLPILYGAILVPEGVVHELATGRTQGVMVPDPHALDWVEVVQAPQRNILPVPADLGRGEREVLSLAVERPGSLALLDDGLARHFAKHLGIPFTGTLGVLLKAKAAGHLDAVRPIIDRLQVLGFWLTAPTRAAVLDLVGEGL